MTEVGKRYASRYRLEEEIGRGGMAVVYRACDERVKRQVAVKVLYPHLAIRKENKIRFQREAETVANLDHRNILKVFDYSGTDSEDNYIVAEYIEGTTLKRFVADHPLLLPEVGAMMGVDIAAALEHAHRNGIVHRDVKPENVMISRQGVLKLMDFGIAQIRDSQQMTVTGTMIGSPAHMSPEHIEGKRLDHRADIFSLGTVLYFLCVGELPFQAPTAHALLKRIFEVDFVPACRANPRVSNDLSAIIDRCLRKDPDERYPSCAALEHDLQSYLDTWGFGERNSELARFFQHPAFYQEGQRTRLTDLLLARGRQLGDSLQLPSALRCLDHALSLSPDQPELLAEVARIRRRVEVHHLMRARVLPAAVLLLLAAGSGGAWWLMREPDDNLRTEVADDRPLPLAEFGGEPSPSPPDLLVQPGSEHAPAPTEAASAGGLSGEPPGPVAKEGDGPAQETDGPRRRAWGELRKLADSAGAIRANLPDLRRLTALAARRATSVPTNGGGGEPAGHAGNGSGAQEGMKEGATEAGGPDVARHGEPANGGKGAAGAAGAGSRNGAAAAGKEGAAKLAAVTIRANPPAAEIWVDGERRGVGKVESLQLRPGRHQLRLHHPSWGEACQDTVDEFLVGEDGRPLDLSWTIKVKPAGLQVNSPGAGMVFVNNELVGRTGAALEFKAASPYPFKVTVKVLFDDAAMAPVERTALVRAGKTVEVELR